MDCSFFDDILFNLIWNCLFVNDVIQSVFGDFWTKLIAKIYRWRTPTLPHNRLSQLQLMLRHISNIFNAQHLCSMRRNSQDPSPLITLSTFHCQSHSTSPSSVIKPALSKPPSYYLHAGVIISRGQSHSFISRAPVLRDLVRDACGTHEWAPR